MGFIFAGQGFKRQRIDTPGSKKGKKARKPKNVVSNAKLGVSTDQSAPMSIMIYPSISNDSVFQQPTPALINYTHIPDERRLNSLVDLPVEVLYRIYTYAGVGPVNRLPSTCHYLYTILDFSHNDYLLAMIVHHNFLFELTKQSEANYWEGKFEKKAKGLPAEYRNTEILESLYSYPISAAKTLGAIDCRIFSFPCIEERHARFILQNFGELIIDEKRAEIELRLKSKFVEWKYMQFKKYVALVVETYNGTSEVNVEQLHLEAVSFEPCVQFKNLHQLESYEPFITTSEIPQYMYTNMTPARLEMLDFLCGSSSVDIKHPGLLVSTFFAHNLEISESSLELLMVLTNTNTAAETDVVAALTTFHECRARFMSVPLERREAHPYERPLGMYFEFLKKLLEIYYQLHPQGKSMVIMHLLNDIQIPELLDHVVGLGVDIPLGIF